jgi:hypothetical protein
MSITPRKVEENARWQCVEVITSALQTISKATGYNTSPMVTRDRRKIKDTPEQFSLCVEEGYESPADVHTHDLEITVSGYIEIKDLDPVKARCALLQDVRTAIMGDLRALAGQIGTGAHVALGRCETDEGMFTDAGWAVFEQTFEIRYPQGAIW